MNEIGPKGFRSSKEQTEPEVSKIFGNIPEWLNGKLLRNGPAKWTLGQDGSTTHVMTHVFDGYNLISKFEIRGGFVTFNSKFLQSEAFKKAEAVQKPVISEYSTRAACADSKKSVFARVISTLIPENTDNSPFISSTGMGNNPIIIGDTGYMFELDKCSLECISRHDPVKELGVHCQSSHPIVDQETQYTYNIGVSIFSGARWNILKFPPASKTNSKHAKESIKKVEILTSFNCRYKACIPWIHSFGMSRNYIICIEQPSYFNIAKVFGSIFSKGVCPKDLNEWRPQCKNRFYIINKSTGNVTGIKMELISKEAFFFYHILNCHEQDEHIVIDVFCMPNFKIVENLTMANLRSGYKNGDHESPTLQRYIIPLMVSDLKSCPENSNLISISGTSASAIRTDGKIILDSEVLSENRMEFSTFNKKFIGRPLRYIWTCGAFAPSSLHHHKIHKFDFVTKKCLTWQGDENLFVGEPLFVPNPNNSDNEEDDGVIINVVTNVREVGKKDFVLFLDSKTLLELGRAEFHADIPISMHGVFISD